MNNDQYLKTALQAAGDAGKIFKQNFGKPHQVTAKGGNPKDLVTEIDLKIEKLIKKLIQNKFPGHNILGEETGWDNADKLSYNWIIDPIDGTTNFIQGIPFCCISIALWHGLDPLVGVVYNPITENLFYAAKGKGAYCNGRPICVSKANSILTSYSAVSWGRGWELGKKIMPYFIENMRKVRTFGAAALETCYVAQGSFDSFVQGKIAIWDIAAAALILTEAGGQATNWQGQPLDLDANNLIASNGQLHRELLKRVKRL